eukprot:scaffold293869_cov30-Prasinocladus_malaysianus.AAC.1
MGTQNNAHTKYGEETLRDLAVHVLPELGVKGQQSGSGILNGNPVVRGAPILGVRSREADNRWRLEAPAEHLPRVEQE